MMMITITSFACLKRGRRAQTEVKTTSSRLKTRPKEVSSPGSIWHWVMLMRKLSRMMMPKACCHGVELSSFCTRSCEGAIIILL